MHFFVVVYALSYVRLFLTPWTVAGQAPRSLGFPRQEYWGGVAISSPRDLPNPGTEPASPALAGEFFTTEPPGELKLKCYSPLEEFHIFSLIDLYYCTQLFEFCQ